MDIILVPNYICMSNFKFGHFVVVCTQSLTHTISSFDAMRSSAYSEIFLPNDWTC